MSHPSLVPFTWREEALPHALAALLEAAGLTDSADAIRTITEAPSAPGEWIAAAARRAVCEADPIITTFGELSESLATHWPALLRLPSGEYLAVLRAKRGQLSLLTPAGERFGIPAANVCRELCAPAEAGFRADFERLLSRTDLRVRRRDLDPMELLLKEQIAHLPFRDGWVLRTAAAAHPKRLVKQAGLLRHAAAMVGFHTAQYLLWLASWAILGKLSFSGHMDRAWLYAWTLLLFTLVPCQLITTWRQGLFAVGLGAFLKRRLLAGALKLHPEEMRHAGMGAFLGQALEAEAVETLALSGGIAGLLAIVELVLALFVLGRFAIVLSFWLLLTILAAWRFLHKYSRWTDTRLSLTGDLIEAMVGHRTRLVQLPRTEWHAGEDRGLASYLGDSKRLDNSGAWLIAAIPRGWLVTGLLCLLPSLATRQTTVNSAALLLGGVLLAYTAFRKLTGSFADAAAAVVACRRIKPLFLAAGRPEPLGDANLASIAGDRPSDIVLEADRLTFRYRSGGKLALASACLEVRAGDRVLLEGPSGGGKTTFASLLAGMRTPESGLLLAGGLDRQTLGDANWRHRIAAAPQFHENHILTETLAFNLLLGRAWPPSPAALAEAETVCRELGLGNLLDTMPGGLLQMVGEGGWQLSHGERSRVFIARALLQSADLVILDESFGALDPENARLALETTLQRARTLMVVAHP